LLDAQVCSTHTSVHGMIAEANCEDRESAQN
jgi:hypothetical protein